MVKGTYTQKAASMSCDAKAVKHILIDNTFYYHTQVNYISFFIAHNTKTI